MTQKLMRIESVVHTNHSVALEERIRKEARTLTQAGHAVHILALELENKSGHGVTQEGIPYQTIRLWTRELFARRRFLWVKALEMQLRFMLVLRRREWEVLWVNDHTILGVLVYGWFCKLFSGNKRLIWDQHELGPERILRWRLYHWLLGACDAVIHANEERAAHLKARVPASLHSRFLIVENYPDRAFAELPPGKQPEKFRRWLNGAPYCLFQGGAYSHRKIFESIEAIYRLPAMKLLVLGPCDDEMRSAIAARWPAYQERVYITGWTPPGEFVHYMDGAQASLVFYENIDQNHWLCAPNRFYHAILRAIPVVCGSNPPMRRIAQTSQLGVICSRNGEDSGEIADAIERIEASHEVFRDNARRVRDQYVWQSQDRTLRQLLREK